MTSIKWIWVGMVGLGFLSAGLSSEAEAAKRKRGGDAATQAAPAEPASLASETRSPEVSSSERPMFNWLDFEVATNLAFGSGGGYSLGPDFAYTPQIRLKSWIALTPRFDLQLFKTPGGIAPLLKLGAEGWLYVLPGKDLYLAPGIGVAMAAETDSTKAFAVLSLTAGYHLNLARTGLLSKLDRLLLRYDALMSADATHQLTAGIGVDL